MYEDRRQITFSVTVPEQKWIELQSGGNVSRWCREKLLVGKEPVKFEHKSLGVPEVGGLTQVEMDRSIYETGKAAKIAVAKTGPKNSTRLCMVCEHGKAKHGGFRGCCQVDNCLCERFK